MPVISLSNIEKTFGQRVLFDHLNFSMEKGERVGFIGANGAGKTSLFKLLTGELKADVGDVSVARSIKLGVLSQDPTFDPTNTVIDEAELAFAELHRLSHQMRDIEHAMADATGDALVKILKKYQDVQHEFDLAGGYAWQHKLEATLLGIGLGRETWEQNVSTLSGGQRSRLALSKLLISAPDVLLLDEPTNHLDLTAIEWLEEYLLDFNGATFLISHDRYLLDRLATRIVWLTRSQLNSYPGNYSAFVAQREVQEISQRRAFEEQQADIEKQKEFIRRFGAGQRSKEAKGREKRLNRLLISDALVQSVDIQKQIHLSINTDQRAGDKVLSVRELSKSYDSRTLWQEISFEIKRGERIGIIGPNGSGKTTLLESLVGRREADNGDIKWGANLNIGYYDQKLDDFDPDNTITEEVRANVEGDVKDQDLRNVLGRMLFRGDDVDKQISLLSGGERARVALCILLLDKPNVLVLDEPTNHLDIASREALEETLKDFAGTILCVSHDRYFLDQVAQRLLILQPPGIADFEGNYSAWMSRLAQKAAAAREEAREATEAKSRRSSKSQPAKQQPKKIDKKSDNPYLRPFGKLSVKELEQQITETEIELAECQDAFGATTSFKDPARGPKLQEQHKQLTKKLQQLEAEYFERER
jgi:ATP-binding cassette subfamily F protein 3